MWFLLYCGGEDKELSRSDTSQPSGKKVRFSEKQSLETFDEIKPPVTPVGKGHSFPNSLRSVLKKTPVKIVAEGLKVGVELLTIRLFSLANLQQIP